jgi:hypothetical protein
MDARKEGSVEPSTSLGDEVGDGVGNVGGTDGGLDVVKVPRGVALRDKLPAKDSVFGEVHVGVKDAGAVERKRRPGERGQVYQSERGGGIGGERVRAWWVLRTWLHASFLQGSTLRNKKGTIRTESWSKEDEGSLTLQRL